MPICTLFDARYLVEGVMCIRSALKWFKEYFYVLCLDQITWDICYELSNQNGYIKPIALYEFEQDYVDLYKCRKTRPWNAYTQTVKVFLPRYIFDRFNEQRLIYVDSDVLFWSDPKLIYKELDENSFIVANRQMSPCPPQGCYNDGFFACNNDKDSQTFFKWWRAKVIDWCLWEQGREDQFTAEGYLNVFYKDPHQFDGIYITNHPGINLAPWNVAKHQVTIEDDCSITIDSMYSLICYHYRGWQLGKCGDCFDPGTHIQNNEVWHLYETYHRLFRETKKELLDVMDKQWR